ncbi:MAG: universal stress protein [Planctomycetes bacterium]|nr:universal stress protein [Planctomycetota bacterium]
MLPIHTILFPTDFSESAQHAFPLACALARDCGAGIVALYVVPPPLGQDQVLMEQNPDEYYEGPRQALREVRAPDQNVRIEHRLEDGDAADEILRVSQEIEAGLIVLGTHGRSGLGRLLLGSVAEKVLHSATCPVLTVKQSSAAPKFQTILCPTDFSDSSEAALDVAFTLTRDYHARLIVLHVAVPEPVVPYAEFEKIAEQSAGRRRELEDKLRRCQKPDCNAEFRLEEGDPADAIIRVALEAPCDLIVMGTHGRTGLRRLLLGSVAEKILRGAPCPALLLKSPIAGVEKG